MTSPRRRPDRPIESVVLKVTFPADRETAERIRQVIPTVKVRGGICEVKIQAERPADVGEKAKLLLEKLRKIS